MYWVSPKNADTVLRVLRVHLISQWHEDVRNVIYPHFTDEEDETWENKALKVIYLVSATASTWTQMVWLCH